MPTRKETWNRNFSAAKEQYDSISDLNWDAALGYDQEVFTHIVSDIIKAEGKRPRPGKRPSLDRQDAFYALKKLSGEQYSDECFDVTMRALSNGRSTRGIAHRTGLNKDVISRLQRGVLKPSFQSMEKLARGFGKDPAYFVEYRAEAVAALVRDYLLDHPETATAWYVKTKRSGKVEG